MADRHSTPATAATTGIKPLFLLLKDLPPSQDKYFSTREICSVAEDALGFNTMEGAQQIGGMWRLYPKTRAARMQLLTSGINLRNSHITLHGENPFLAGRADGREIETTKVIVSNIPISFSNEEIEKVLLHIGCKPVSRMVEECDRDDNGKLTRWKTGRRFMFMERPNQPLPKQVQMGSFTARLYHREQNLDANPFCGNCLSFGHRKGECEKDVVCRICRHSGHKAGDILCKPIGQGEATPTDAKPEAHDDDNNTDKTIENESSASESDGESESDDREDEKLSSSNESASVKAEKKEIRKRKRKQKKKTGKKTTSSSNTGSENVTPERQAKQSRAKGSSSEDLGESGS